MIKTFNDLPWHDAQLIEINIHRDSRDIVRLLISWPDHPEGAYQAIEFFDCYAFQSDMHFVIIPPDSILQAECIERSKELDDIKKLWAKIGVNLSELHCYRITTNSTNSILNIFALGFRVIKHTFNSEV
jgi:hypothetical protein